MLTFVGGAGRPDKREAQLSQKDRATRYVRWKLVKYCTTVRKITS